MKTRQIKKMAKRWMSGTQSLPLKTFDFGRFEVTTAIMPAKVASECRKMAYRAGWDGNHWSDPLVVNVYDPGDYQ